MVWSKLYVLLHHVVINSTAKCWLLKIISANAKNGKCYTCNATDVHFTDSVKGYCWNAFCGGGGPFISGPFYVPFWPLFVYYLSLNQHLVRFETCHLPLQNAVVNLVIQGQNSWIRSEVFYFINWRNLMVENCKVCRIIPGADYTPDTVYFSDHSY